jgi:hypothetical protein
MFNDPKASIGILQSLGEDGEFGATDRRSSYLFPPSFEDKLDSGEHGKGLHKPHHHFKRKDSDDVGSHSDADDSSDDDDDDLGAAPGPATEAPEPGSLLLLGTGLLSLLALKKFM